MVRKTASGVPAAAQTSSSTSRSRSRNVADGLGVTERRRPPHREPGRGPRLLRVVAPSHARGPARLGQAARVDPVRARSSAPARAGRPPTNTRDFTIWPTSQPIARAASAAVFVPSGNRRTSTSWPSTRAASRNRSIALLTAATIPPRGGYDTAAATRIAPRPRPPASQQRSQAGRGASRDARIAIRDARDRPRRARAPRPDDPVRAGREPGRPTASARAGGTGTSSRISPPRTRPPRSSSPASRRPSSTRSARPTTASCG